MTACTSESGASARAATWKIQAPAATSIPIANHFDLKRPMPLRRGCANDTSGAAQAPLCLSRKPRFVASAQKNASRMPSWRVI